MHGTYRLLYRLGITPWEDTTGHAAELVARAVPGPPGRAVDLGCGTGRQARALAARGWTVTGVDDVPAAIAAARRLDPDGHVTWLAGDVTDPGGVDPDGRLTGAVTLILDNGCLHGIPARLRPGWLATVNRLAAPGADLLIRAMPRQRRPIGPAGIDAGDLHALLGDAWTPRPAPGRHWYHYRGHAPEARA